MKTYNELNAVLTGRNSARRKLANNTYAERRDNGAIAVRLHDTDVVTYYEDGRIVLNSGGWKTSTTKDRLNSYSPARVSQDRGQWTVYCNGSEGVPYFDGIEIKDGHVTNPPKASAVEAEKKLRKRIAAYAALVGSKLPLEMPGAGDCFYCGMREVQTGKPLGECNHDTDHLELHMKEKYVVPSLVWRAIEHAGCNPQGSGCAWFDAAFGQNSKTDWQRKQVTRFVRKYLYRQFGLVG